MEIVNISGFLRDVIGIKVKQSSGIEEVGQRCEYLIYRVFSVKWVCLENKFDFFRDYLGISIGRGNFQS